MMKFGGIAIVALGLLGLGQAQAADLAARPYTKAPALTPVYNWTGFYIGGHVGYGWAETDHTMSASFALGTLRATSNRDGFLGGGQIGYNWQSGALVLGIEADASWTDINGTGVAVGGGGPFQFTTRNDWVATVTGRIGFAVNNVLFYGKGGGAFTELKYNNFFAGAAPLTVASFSDTRTGWTVGAGVEYGEDRIQLHGLWKREICRRFPGCRHSRCNHHPHHRRPVAPREGRIELSLLIYLLQRKAASVGGLTGVFSCSTRLRF